MPLTSIASCAMSFSLLNFFIHVYVLVSGFKVQMRVNPSIIALKIEIITSADQHYRLIDKVGLLYLHLIDSHACSLIHVISGMQIIRYRISQLHSIAIDTLEFNQQWRCLIIVRESCFLNTSFSSFRLSTLIHFFPLLTEVILLLDTRCTKALPRQTREVFSLFIFSSLSLSCRCCCCFANYFQLHSFNCSICCRLTLRGTYIRFLSCFSVAADDGSY